MSGASAGMCSAALVLVVACGTDPEIATDDIARTLDAYVSVLDPATGDVLHQRRFDRVFAGIGGGLVIEPRPDDLGFQPLFVHRLTLRTDP